ncbi:MAG TPA: peroxiredoxin [Candidatus Baltobacteraceae bacterium]|nr:peroxiredoxin [Candidatus Baltobacteraceae bacterium]
MFRRLLAALVLIAAASAPALASLSPGAAAPSFQAQASMGGKVFTFNLASALKKGPVVLYFYPAAFTKGCTIEAHDFAAAIDRYKKLNATVIGVSHDTIGTLNRFSVSECRSKFPVAADPKLKVAKAYDAVLPEDTSYANRTSYVIAPTGKIFYAYTNMEPDKHVANTLDALRRYEASAAH